MRSWIFGAATLLLAMLMLPAAHADDIATQIRQHAADHRLLVLGEYHGTRETPLLVRRLVDDYGRDGTPVVLALELPRGETPVIAQYLDSNGDDAAGRRLRARRFWAVVDDQHDGRRSRDMLALIEALRVMKAEGRDVRVLGYDVDASEAGNQGRDDAMAAELRRLHQQMPARGRLIVLTGNVHAMLQRPEGAPEEMQLRPMASSLRDLDPYSVRLEALRGESWSCTDRCRARPLPERAARAPRVDTHDRRLYDLVVWMPGLSVAKLVD